MKIAIVTACPSGIANSIIAAGVLTDAAKKLNWECAIECHSTVVETKVLTEDQIDQADVIILATNVELDSSRFKNKKVYQSDISECLKEGEIYLENALKKAVELKNVATVETINNRAKKIVAITACPTGETNNCI